MIKVNSLSKTYSTGILCVEALKNLDLDIAPGDFVAVMGPSGSGKSTFMNILGCLDRPTSGEYILDGVAINSMAESELAVVRNQKIGFVFQTFNLLPRMDAQRNVELPLVYSGVEIQERKRRSRMALERVGLLDHARHRPNELSGGQRQRVAIARALVNNPVILLADEPTGNLDTRAGLEIMGLIQELHQQGSTIILVTHEPEIASHAQKVIHFRDGMLVNSENIVQPLQASVLLKQLGQAEDKQ
jgi:putative ABC transport system ATP-binding protein